MGFDGFWKNFPFFLQAMTLKCLGQYNEAVACGQRQLDIYRKLNDDKTAVSRALYNIGNIYLAKAKAAIAASMDGDLPEEAKEDLLLGLEHYKENYEMVKEFCDLAAQGRGTVRRVAMIVFANCNVAIWVEFFVVFIAVCGNLGSVQYMLGNFPQASCIFDFSRYPVDFHRKWRTEKPSNGSLIDWLIDWLLAWLIALIDWLLAWLIAWLIAPLIDWLIHWLIDFSWIFWWKISNENLYAFFAFIGIVSAGKFYGKFEMRILQNFLFWVLNFR